MRVLISLFTILFLLPAEAGAQAQTQEAPPPGPCEFFRGATFKLLEEWTKTCGHPLCGQIHIADPGRLKPAAEKCEHKAWLSMKDDIRDTVVGGGVVLYGENHDNPLHHELRSRLGLSNYTSSVFEQISADAAPGLETFMKDYGRKYDDTSLAKFKAAVKWEASGWAKYKYDELLLAALRAQKPIVAGDAAQETMKTIAKSGLGGIDTEEQKRLKLDVPLGEKADAEILDGLFEAHCKAMPRETLSNMALAQRFRDATLADNAMAAAAKYGATVVFAGNEHVRKDRGVPWYVQQRSPGKKTLSVLLVEVEDAKTDADAYVPKDPDGKPAADYVIFTPRVPHEDHCAEMKAK